MVKIAVAQMDVVPNRPDLNVEKMLSMIKRAKENKADLIAFPEMCIGGYLLGDKWCSDEFCRNLMSWNEKIIDASDGIAIAFGNVFLDEKINERVKDDAPHPGKDGRTRKYNAVYVCQNKKPAKRAKDVHFLPDGVQPKTLLPNYRFFDDERYFFSMQDIAKDFCTDIEEITQPFEIETKEGRMLIGFELCEDLWCSDYRRCKEPVNPTKYLIRNGAEIIVNISASPWTYRKNDARDRRIKFLVKEIGNGFVPFVYVNCTGAQNNGKNIITFDGGSTVYDSEGNIIMMSNRPYEEELLFIDNFSSPPIRREEKGKIEQKYDAIIRGIRHMKDIAGMKVHPKFVIGVSGGIDSAVTCALLVCAVGRENVTAVSMPSRFNSEKTKNAAKEIAKNLGVEFFEVPIEDMTSLNIKIVDEIGEKRLSELNIENIQAKIRGTCILSNLAAKLGAIFTNNGNKLEIALGYATLYGDVNGAIAPIGDLTKSEVYELGRFLNKNVFKKTVIPENLFPDELFRFSDEKIQPSAELKENQVDPMKFGYHCALIEQFTDYMKKSPEDVMRWYIEGTLESRLNITTDLIKRWGIDDPKEFVKDLEWFASQIEKNVFKRVQAPPIILTSKSAYGYDIRESQLPVMFSEEYKKLKERVLSMEKYKPR